MEKTHASVTLVIEIIIIMLFYFLTEYSLPVADQLQYWKTLQDVHVMLFVGFGFLMVFLKRYSWGAVGFTYLVGCICIQLGMLFNGLIGKFTCNPAPSATDNKCTPKIQIDLTALIGGDVAGVTALISVGAVLGKLSAFQFIIMMIFEMFFYCLNSAILFDVLGVADVGGSIVIHLFGAVFGIIVSITACNKQAPLSKHMGESYLNDLLAMVGTLFLFLYWPSFNGGLSHDTNFHRVVLNTALSLVASVLSTMILSSLINHNKFKMEHILNATLAGGVMMGTAADQIVNPGAAFTLGFFAGIISTLGYGRLSEWVSRVYHDTCGITYLHGIPGLMGGLIGVFTALTTEQSDLQSPIGTVFPKRGPGLPRTASQQATIELLGILITISISAFTAFLVGLLLRSGCFNQIQKIDRMFLDDVYWEAVDGNLDDGNDREKQVELQHQQQSGPSQQQK